MPILVFDRGRFRFGPEKDEVAKGTKMIAGMNLLQIGWIKWRDGEVVDERLGLLKDGHVPPNRSELGDTDPETWDNGRNGEPRDPW